MADEPGDDDLNFVTLALAHKLVTREQVDSAQEIIDRDLVENRPTRPIEVVLQELGWIKPQEIWAVNKARERFRRDAQTTGERIGGYEILGKLGEGGLGVVYKARQISMGRIVALKVLHEKWMGDDEFRKRFLVEARLVGRLSHPNLIQVFDIGWLKPKTTLYYSMEFINGESVEKRLDRDGSMPLDASLDIIGQTARALEYLHSRGIVHRDVKPGNIMVTRSGLAKLGDFGFVKSPLDAILSTSGEVLGTPDYISPECAMGERDLDWRSDMYSLGATFYHMLTGRPPFNGTSSEVMDAHIRMPLPPIRSLRPEISERVEHLINRMLEKNPAKRHNNFDEFFEELALARLDGNPPDPKAKPSSQVMRVLSMGGQGIDEILREKGRLERKCKYLTIALAGSLAVLVVTITAGLIIIFS